MKFATLATTLLSMATLATGCAQKIAFNGADATQSEASVDPTSPECQPGQSLINKPIKFILVVDQSGSNLSGPAEHPFQGTDPDKRRRYDAIAEFFLLHGPKRHVAWSFIGFQGSGAYALTSNGNSLRPEFVGFTDMINALKEFKQTKDDGVTPYLAGLGMARELIARDIQSGVSVGAQYRIAFITDGYPTDLPAGMPGEAKLDADLQSLVALAPAAIQVSTVYYGFPDATAAARLERMATLGKGQFLDAGNSKDLRLGDALAIPKPVCN